MIAEFKLALDIPASGKWEDTCIHMDKATGLIAQPYDDWAIAWASYLRDTYGCKVRWNWQGSLQGHYVEAK